MIEVGAKDIRRSAMDLLARREHSILELSQKLTKKFGHEEDAIAKELDKLQSEGLQSNRRLAEAFIRARTNRGQGPVKIRMELRGKGLENEMISLAFEESKIDWFDLVQQVAVRKFGEVLKSPSDMKTKARISRFLQQRGFNFDHISSLY